MYGNLHSNDLKSWDNVSPFVNLLEKYPVDNLDLCMNTALCKKTQENRAAHKQVALAEPRHDTTTRTETYELFIAPSWAAREPGVGLLPHRKQNLAGVRSWGILNTRATATTSLQLEDFGNTTVSCRRSQGLFMINTAPLPSHLSTKALCRDARYLIGRDAASRFCWRWASACICLHTRETMLIMHLTILTTGGTRRITPRRL
jgi:hypothetical protein